jgi:hypothetical protein
MNNDQYDEIDRMFGGGGAPAVSFKAIGDSVAGVITDLASRQQRDYEDNSPKVWADTGKPMMELIVTLDTGIIDPTIEDDDGSRRVFVRGAMLTAFGDACRLAKTRRPEVGGKVTITHSGLGTPSNPRFNAPKLFAIAYEPPTAVAMDAMLGTTTASTATTTTVEGVPVAEMSQEQILAAAAQLDPAALSKMLGELAAAK